ncbi:MAG: histidine kinase dimerization/phospho-acceptor domain-containing protein [Chitinophagales bacterium]
MFFQKKISRIALLMMVSELLISLFVIRWLQSEFNGEKLVLQKNLAEQFMSAKSRVMDSIIAKNLIDPILNDPKGFRVRTIHEENEIGTDSFKIFTYNTSSDTIIPDSPETKMKLKPGDHLRQQERITLRITHDSVDDELYRGVKLFISKAAGAEGEADFFERHLKDGDTALLKTYFTENLQKRQLNLRTSWTSDAPEKSLPQPFYFESHFFQQPYGVQIEAYNSFLAVKILPQIVFALLLLIFTSGAFLFSFRSLRNQLKLSAMKDDFIGNMSHELKTPLATIKIAVEAMQ